MGSTPRRGHSGTVKLVGRHAGFVAIFCDPSEEHAKIWSGCLIMVKVKQLGIISTGVWVVTT